MVLIYVRMFSVLHSGYSRISQIVRYLFPEFGLQQANKQVEPGDESGVMNRRLALSIGAQVWQARVL